MYVKTVFKDSVQEQNILRNRSYTADAVAHSAGANEFAHTGLPTANSVGSISGATGSGNDGAVVKSKGKGGAVVNGNGEGNASNKRGVSGDYGRNPSKIAKTAVPLSAKELKAKNDRRDLMKRLGDMKKRMDASVSLAADLFTEISCGGVKEWEYFNNSMMLKPLVDSKQAVDNFKTSSQFYKAWVLETNFDKWLKANDTKKNSQDAARLDDLEKLIKQVDKEVANLKNMKAARSAD